MQATDKSSPIVCLLFRRVGDSLLATPAIRAIRKAHPDRPLYVVAESGMERVFQGNPNLDDLLILPSFAHTFRLSRVIRSQGRPFVTIDFHSDPRTAVASFLAGAHNRIGFQNRGRSWMYTATAPVQNPELPIYSADHKSSLAALLGASPVDKQTEFHLSPEDENSANDFMHERGLINEKIVALNIHSRQRYKQWALENFTELANSIISSGRSKVILISAPEEAEHAEKFARQMGVDSRFQFVAKNLGEMAAMLKRCTVYAGNDGGAKHLAVAMGTPTVTVFRFEPPEYWTPPDSSKHIFFDDRIAGTAKVADVTNAILSFCK